MASDLPVVATDVGGNREIVIDGETGFLVPVSDAKALATKLIYLLQNPDDAIRMGHRARERISREFSINAMIQKHQDYYRDILISELHGSQ